MVVSASDNSGRDKALALFTSGLLSTVVGYPLDLIRTRILFGNSVGAFTGMGKGLPYTVMLSTFKSGCVWPIQEECEKRVKTLKVEHFYAVLLSGGISNVIPTLFFSPFNVVKVHLIRDSTKQNAFTVAKNIYHTHGLGFFYKGVIVTMFKDFLWGALYFPAVDNLKDRIEKKCPELNKTVRDTSAIFIGAVWATAATSSIDAFRLHRMNEDKVQLSFMQTLKKALALTKPNLLATLTGVTRVSMGVTIGHTAYLYIINKLEKKI